MDVGGGGLTPVPFLLVFTAAEVFPGAREHADHENLCPNDNDEEEDDNEDRPKPLANTSDTGSWWSESGGYFFWSLLQGGACQRRTACCSRRNLRGKNIKRDLATTTIGSYIVTVVEVATIAASVLGMRRHALKMWVNGEEGGGPSYSKKRRLK